MPQRKSSKDEPKPADGAATSTVALAEELRQPLAAATNYIGVARLLLDGLREDQARTALQNLDAAETQLIRAGDIIGKLRRSLKVQVERS